ncbi:MAG TPA: M56 family metallopeptidase [Longimicrobiales bacterium]|nr:M56 family metallopeptidase [Longimicrobiales bacterium]
MMSSFSWLALPATRLGLLPPVVEAIAKGTVLLAVVFVLTAVLRRTSAGTRHILWSGALVGVLALPLLTMVVPPLRVLPAAVATRAAYAAFEAAPVGELPDAAPAVSMSSSAGRSERPALRAADGGAAPSAAPSLTGPERGESAGGPSRAVIVRVLLFLWAVVAAVLLGRVAAGAASVWRIVRRGEALDSPAWKRPLFEAADRLDLAREPRLLWSEEVQLPFTAGLFQPTIVLPSTADGWSDERRRAVLLHELAHVRRRDLFSHLLGRVACAVYWFNPLVWLAARRARAESERACDDLVLSVGTRASTYADHLLQIVCGAAGTSAPVVAIPMAQRKEFEGRMLAILEPGARRDAPGRFQSLGLGSALAALALCVAAAAPARPVDPAAGERELAAPAPLPQDTPPAAPAAALPSATLAPVTPVAGTPADTGRGRRHGRSMLPVVVDGDAIASTVEQALAAVDVGEITRTAMQGVSHAFSGGGLATPTPTPTPAPTPMVFGGWNVGKKHGTPAPKVWKPPQREKQADPRTVEALIEATRDSEPDVRVQAVHALGELGDPKAVAALGAALRGDANAGVRKMAAWSLGEIGDAAAVPHLAVAVRTDRDVEVRKMAAWALGEIGHPDGVAPLGDALRDGDAGIRAMAAWAIAEIGQDSGTAALAGALRDASPEVRRKAAWGLGEIGPDRAPAALVAALKDDDAGVRKMAAWALGEIEDEATAPALGNATDDPDPGVRRSALWALGQIGGPAAREPLMKALKSSDPEIRKIAARAIANTF